MVIGNCTINSNIVKISDIFVSMHHMLSRLRTELIHQVEYSYCQHSSSPLHFLTYLSV